MQQALIDKGILRPSGEIVKDKINLISGARTPPFMKMLWAVTNGDTDTTDRVYTLLSVLYADGRESEMQEVLRTLYGVLGLPFPEDVEQLPDRRPATVRRIRRAANDQLHGFAL